MISTDDRHLAKFLPDERIILQSLLAHKCDEPVEFGAEKQRQRGGLVASFETEQRLRDLPARVHRADDVVGSGARPGEEDLGELRVSIDHADRADLDSGLVERNQQEADAAVTGRFRIGAGQHENPIGAVGGRGPDLLAVDDPLRAVQPGASRQRGQVGAGSRLGIALAPDVLHRPDTGKEVLLLLLRAPHQQRVGEHLDAVGVGGHAVRQAGAGEFIDEHHLMQSR